MYVIKGDTDTFTVSCVDEDGVALPFVYGDRVFFTVKASKNTAEKVLQKIVGTFVDGKAIVDILPADTGSLRSMIYVYDVQYSMANGVVKTLVPPSKFVLEGEVTYD